MLTWANQWHLMTKNGICSLSLTEWHLIAINNKSRLAIQQSQTAIAIV